MRQYITTCSYIFKNTSLCELENTTLQKQRAEIQLLVSELRDRDRELSEMMTSQQQLQTAWETDKSRLASLQTRCQQYEGMVKQDVSLICDADTDFPVCVNF